MSFQGSCYFCHMYFYSSREGALQELRPNHVSEECKRKDREEDENIQRNKYTHSLSNSATVHLYCAVEKRHISANWRTGKRRKNQYIYKKYSLIHGYMRRVHNKEKRNNKRKPKHKQMEEKRFILKALLSDTKKVY